MEVEYQRGSCVGKCAEQMHHARSRKGGVFIASMQSDQYEVRPGRRHAYRSKIFQQAQR